MTQTSVHLLKGDRTLHTKERLKVFQLTSEKLQHWKLVFWMGKVCVTVVLNNKAFWSPSLNDEHGVLTLKMYCMLGTISKNPLWSCVKNMVDKGMNDKWPCQCKVYTQYGHCVAICWTWLHKLVMSMWKEIIHSLSRNASTQRFDLF